MVTYLDPLYLATGGFDPADLDAILADAEALAFDDCPIAAGSLVALARDHLRQPCPDCGGELGHVAGTINGPAWLDCPTCGAGGPTLGTDLPCDCPPPEEDWTPEYSSWRHGGWYVHNIGYINGTSGCVSRNYPDGKWRIVCDPRPFEQAPTFRTRHEAARAERAIALSPDRSHADLQQERDHFNVMRERFGADGSTAAFYNWNQSAIRYCERYGHLPPAELVSVKIAKQYAHLPEHPSECACDPHGAPEPEPDPDMLTACQAEARFGLEEALRLLSLISTDPSANITGMIHARITQAISVLP